MKRAERKARMIIAIKMMEEVIADATAELREEGEPVKAREVWQRCGMPLMTHDTQLMQFIAKQRLEFV